MDSERSTTKKEGNIVGNGWITKCKAEERSTTRMESLPTKGNGVRT